MLLQCWQTIYLQWCYSVVSVLLQCCYSVVTFPSLVSILNISEAYLSGVTVLLQWCYSVKTVVLRCWYSDVTVLVHSVDTVVLQCCYSVVTVSLHSHKWSACSTSLMHTILCSVVFCCPHDVTIYVVLLMNMEYGAMAVYFCVCDGGGFTVCSDRNPLVLSASPRMPPVSCWLRENQVTMMLKWCENGPIMVLEWC
jgi:hypothetical protein